jgi:hypothetical protein
LVVGLESPDEDVDVVVPLVVVVTERSAIIPKSACDEPLNASFVVGVTAAVGSIANTGVPNCPTSNVTKAGLTVEVWSIPNSDVQISGETGVPTTAEEMVESDAKPT